MDCKSILLVSYFLLLGSVMMMIIIALFLSLPLNDGYDLYLLIYFFLYASCMQQSSQNCIRYHQIVILFLFFMIAGEITLVRPLDEISAITHIGDPVLLTVIAEEVKVARNEPSAMATTVQLALFLPERSNSPPYFENDQ